MSTEKNSSIDLRSEFDRLDYVRMIEIRNIYIYL
jgi:hypothetical protein